MALELFDKAKQTVAEKVALMEKAGVKVTNVSIKRVGIDSATINTAIDINNPYCLCLNLPIHEISYRVRSGGRFSRFSFIYFLCFLLHYFSGRSLVYRDVLFRLLFLITIIFINILNNV